MPIMLASGTLSSACQLRSVEMRAVWVDLPDRDEEHSTVLVGDIVTEPGVEED